MGLGLAGAGRRSTGGKTREVSVVVALTVRVAAVVVTGEVALGGKTVKPSKTHKINCVIREVTPSRAERVALKDVAIAAAVAMRKRHGSSL